MWKIKCYFFRVAGTLSGAQRKLTRALKESDISQSDFDESECSEDDDKHTKSSRHDKHLKIDAEYTSGSDVEDDSISVYAESELDNEKTKKNIVDNKVSRAKKRKAGKEYMKDYF